MTKRRHHPIRDRLRGFGYFGRLGPAIVTGAADDDPSGIGTYSQVGAALGFGMLWTALVTLPLAAAVQETAARIGIASDGGLATALKRRYPRWVLWLAVSLVTVANVFNIAADIGSMAAAFRLLVPVPLGVAMVALVAALLALEIFVRYERYARVLRWLSLSVVSYVAVLFVLRVDWGDVLRATFLPRLALDRTQLAALVAIFGTTISPYLFFWQASEEAEEEELEAARGEVVVDRDHVAAMRGDVVAGMASAVVVMFAIMVAAAATLHAEGITQIRTAEDAARALRPIAGDFASLLFTLGIVGTGALAIPILAGSTAYALSEAFGWREGLSRRLRQAGGFYGVIVGSAALGLIIALAGLDPIRGLYWAAILNGVAAPPLILLMLLLGRDRSIVGEWRSGRVSTALVAVAFVVMAAAPLAFLAGR
ncbi:MAG: Nramp family divalent metal transporter [Actinomycetota bacterium]